MAGVKAEHLAPGSSVEQIEFMGTNGTTFTADAEKFGFNGISFVLL